MRRAFDDLRDFFQMEANKLYGKDVVEVHLSRNSLGHITEFCVINRTGYLTVLAFTLMQFPSCCAMGLLHGFRIGLNEPEDKTHALLDIVLGALYSHVGGFHKNGRLVLTMIQKEPVAMKKGEEPVLKSPAESKDSIQHAHLFTYMHKQKKVNTSLMHNQNTGRIIHHMEVLFDLSLPHFQ